MRFKRQLKTEHGVGQINIVPLIDLLFLLLIFLMLCTPFTFPTNIQVKLPKALTSDTIKDEAMTITITGEDIIYLNGKITAMKELQQVLGLAENLKRQILIKSDRRASMGRIVDVWDLCRRSGIEKINIATNQDN